ncbi:hypothetical protein B0G75_101551 [Paraburkholderia sp. BL18I3N2]|nr:hypothetical protein B0G75_101551 [Paraburkholderia sp. BL18I3N2]
MKVRSIAALLVASITLLAAPAFAGGNDQTSSDRSDVATSVVHRSQTTQAKAAAEGHGSVVDVNHSGVGGSESGKSQSGRRAPGDSINPMYHGG